MPHQIDVHGDLYQAPPAGIFFGMVANVSLLSCDDDVPAQRSISRLTRIKANVTTQAVSDNAPDCATNCEGNVNIRRRSYSRASGGKRTARAMLSLRDRQREGAFFSAEILSSSGEQRVSENVDMLQLEGERRELSA